MKDREKRSCQCLVLSLFLCAFFWCPSKLFAYRVTGDLPEFSEQASQVKWAESTLTVRLGGVSTSGLSESDVQDAVESAYALWSNINCGAPSIEITSSPDALVELTWIDESEDAALSPSSLGIAELSYQSSAQGWRISGARVRINARAYLSLPELERRGTLHVALVHELGHVLGLLHPCEFDGRDGAPRCTSSTYEQSLVYPVYQSTAQNGPSPDDVAGLCAIYAPGPGGAEEQFKHDVESLADKIGDSCSLHDDCGTGVCVEEGYCSQTCTFLSACSDALFCQAGFCKSDLGKLGDPCQQATDCVRGICLLNEDRSGTCTRTCEGNACPDGFSCVVLEEDTVCVARSAPASCSIKFSSDRVPLFGGSWTLLLCAAMRFQRRRKSHYL